MLSVATDTHIHATARRSGVLPLPDSRGHADMCFEDQTTPATQGEPNAALQLKGKHKEGINVLGIITLHDVDMLERGSQTGRGWIACTTDAVFLEKPQYYDLTIDLTFYAPTERRATGPAA
ncbi:hypothetical protein EDB85DRAFT_1989478, partial [Lactarius pseudohatsudake]